jgi:hypothetical protein
MNEAGVEQFVAEEAQHRVGPRWRPRKRRRMAGAAVDGGGRDEAAPALSTTWTQKGKMVFS